MGKQNVTTTAAPKVVLDINGNLTLKGWDELEVVAKCDSPENLTVEQNGDECGINTVSITCRTDCIVRVPYGASVGIDKVNGNATIKSLEGELSITLISGNLILRSVAATHIDVVSGNLTAKHVSGDLRIKTVNGHATVKDVQGNFTVAEAINGNLTLKDMDGDASAIARGNAILRFDPDPGNTYSFRADGNLICRIAEDASLVVIVEQANRIVVKLPEIDVPSSSKAPLKFSLGEGDGELKLSAGGDVIISAQPVEWDEEDLEVNLDEDFDGMAESISQQVTHQIETQMDMLVQQLETQMEHLTTTLGGIKLSPERVEQIAERARQAGERAAGRTQEKLQRAQERLQRKLESARRRAETHTRAAEHMVQDRRHRHADFPVPPSFGWPPPQPPVPPSPASRPVKPEPPSEPVGDDERLMILQMLEQKKITADEAEQLLSALEGRSA